MDDKPADEANGHPIRRALAMLVGPSQIVVVRRHASSFCSRHPFSDVAN
jgi:hypothetical protein